MTFDNPNPGADKRKTYAEKLRDPDFQRDELRRLAVNLARSRRESREMHLEFLDFVCDRDPLRECEDDSGSGPCYNDGGLAREEWCAFCAERQPYWERRNRAAIAAGAALRAVVLAGKAIAAIDGEDAQ